MVIAAAGLEMQWIVARWMNRTAETEAMLARLVKGPRPIWSLTESSLYSVGLGQKEIAASQKYLATQVNMDLCRMHFYKHMHGFFMHSISLPEKVKKHFAPLAGKVLELKRPGGDIWYVGLIKTGEKLVLDPGWYDFVSANGVSQNDLLVFKYNSEITFEVLIFDQSGSEKSTITEDKSNDNMPIVIKDE